MSEERHRADWEYPDASEATLVVCSETERAEMLRREELVVERHGRYWRRVRPGVFEPVHYLACMSADEIGRPTPTCWAWKAALKPDHISHANGFIPVHLVEDVRSYGPASMERRKREELKKCRRLIRFVHITDSKILRADGWKVVLSTAARAPFTIAKTEREYQAWADREASDRRTVIVGGLRDNLLVGFMTAYAVEDTGYLHGLMVSKEHLSTGVSTGLYHEMMQLFKRIAGIKQVSASYHIPEDRGLCTYKARIGLPLAYIPSRFSLRPPVGQMLRMVRPGTYYRFSGLDPGRGLLSPAEETAHREALERIRPYSAATH
ncbi:MAG: GNAT family N-acetyltransferase [Armatimonadetes bacterium]|nr:GNAT family N-acetyltransferase [Armatimonadota bacterium]